MEHDGLSPVPSTPPEVRALAADVAPTDLMEHDGLPPAPSTPLEVRAPAADVAPTPVTPSGSGSQGVGVSGAPDGGTPNPPRGAGSRIFCPVVGCPEALISSNRYFRDFASMKIHLNDHITGHLSGAVSTEFLNKYNYSQCRACDKVLSKRFRGICLSCRPRVRTQSQLNIIRSSANTTNSNPTSSHQSQPSTAPRALPSLAEIHERYTPTIKNIPKPIRKLFAQCLTKSLAQAVWTNNTTSWSELQMLAKCTLCQPPRAGKAHVSQRLTWSRSRLLRWLAGERAELWIDLPTYKRPKPRKFSAEAALIKCQEKCISLAGEGGFSNACNTLISPPPLGHTAEIAGRLADKHPTADRPIDLSNLGNTSSAVVPLADIDLVEKCIRSFHRLSGGGPSGLKPIHLKNCMATEHRDEVLERCCALLNMLAKEEAPITLAPFLAGANLTALPKKDDGFRPVAVGEVWRRLTAKYLCNIFKEQARTHFFPLQIGVAQPLGTEVGLETARQWSHRNKNNLSAILVKIDFSNAFNCVDRQVFLEQCRHHFPGLSKWAEWCYAQPANLYFGSDTISSEKGVQQGDPIGPMLFALALHPLLQEVNNGRSEGGLELNYSYLDDLILAGEQNAVAGFFHYLKRAASQIGLDFNTSKCEVIPPAGPEAIINRELFPNSIIYRDDGNFELLGGPIGSDSFCNQHT